MLKRIVPILLIVFVMLNLSIAQAQDEGALRVAVAEYMHEPLIAAGIHELGFELELIPVKTEEFGRVVARGVAAGEFDIVIADNISMSPVVERVGVGSFTSICDLVPEVCDPPEIDLCKIAPWACDPWPPCQVIDCPPIVWDKPIIVDPWDPMPWELEDLIQVIRDETIMFDPSNMIGFEVEPAVFSMIDFKPTFTDDMNEAFLMFTMACNYVMHFDEFNEAGFIPITVEGYVENNFSVSSYLVSEGGQLDTAAKFAGELVSNGDLQTKLFETTGLLPGDQEALAGILPQ